MKVVLSALALVLVAAALAYGGHWALARGGPPEPSRAECEQRIADMGGALPTPREGDVQLGPWIGCAYNPPPEVSGP